ncbi:centrosomal protein of 95 kDa [Dendropsophus ebraccatus]|uniref:centrosomal protein of 95 kDa n=1 Tax=Dendropsophus ebraccatus TaxID=150705 RepID=UPI0038312D39
MGTQETDWVTVARSLLSRCHVKLPLRHLAHCDARFFVAIYEAILGEKVPDYIPDSRSPEDDAHNVQSVIDSLALDYLQVSLSHITGENIVRGDTESICNLLEIFDGLLEYLTEQISEASSQTGEDLESKDQSRRGRHKEVPGDHSDLPPSLRPPPSVGSLSSDLLAPSGEVDGSESTAELIRLGDTAHTFTLRGLDVETVRSLAERALTPRITVVQPPAAALTGDERLLMNGHSQDQDSVTQHEGPTAIPLSPPYQPRGVNRDVQVSLGSAGSSCQSPAKSKEYPDEAEVPGGHSVTNGDVDHGLNPVLRQTERRSAVESPCEGHQKKVAFRTQPDVRLMTLQSSLSDCWNSGDVEQEDELHPEDGGDSLLTPPDPLPLSLADEPLSVQRARNRLSELELQEMSEKLSRRLDELDKMLKKALGSQSQSSELKEDDKLSQHSDSIMEIRRKKKLHAAGRARPPSTRPRSMSSSPLPPPHRSLSAQFEDVLNKEARGEMGKIRRDVQKELDLERLKARLLQKAYEGELKDFEETEKQKLAKLNDDLQEKQQEYKENMFKEPPKKSHPERVYSGKRTQPPPKPKQCAPSLHRPANRMKIKENDLLPLLLEEFPHLQISQQTLSNMWREQLEQGELLARSGQEDERSERHLQREVEEAHKKHDLLVTLIQKEQEHNQRLKDFKDRIRLQKSAQNRMRDNRQQAARAKKYYEDYHVQLRAKLMRARTREERIFKKLFEDGLELQKQRLREIRSYAKDQRQEQRRRHKEELESMENYYKDQFSMLAEAVSQEKQEIQAREKAQSKNLHKIKHELRSKMEKEIQDLQELILRTDEDAFFRELEAERLRRRLQMASFQYSKSHCL